MAKKSNKAGKTKKVKGDIVASLTEIQQVTAAGRTGLIDSALISMLDFQNAKIAAAAEQTHLVVHSAERALAEFICLPMPALAPRFLFQSEGIPLTRFFLVSGKEESCKTAFTFEMGRWHRLAGGNLFVIECEAKDSTSLCDSLFNYDRLGWKKSRAHTQEEWNQSFFHQIKLVKSLMDGYEIEQPDSKGKMKKVKVPGVGRICPIMTVVDSISAVLIERFVNQMQDEGSPTLTHPLQAKLMADFFRVGPKELVDFPMSFVAVSHVKMSTDPRMPHIQVRNTTGGKSPKFQMTCEIAMSRDAKNKSCQQTRTHPVLGEIYSIPLKMETLKNSFGGHAAIDVEMVWYFDPNDRDLDNKPRQKTYFDWHSASIELLIDCSRGGYTRAKAEAPGNPEKTVANPFSASRAKRLVGIVDIHEAANRTCWSSALGISEDSKLSFLEAGQVLESRLQQDVDFRNAVYEVLGIQRRFMFQPGVDYREQIARHLEIQQRESSSRCLPGDSPAPSFGQASAGGVDLPVTPSPFASAASSASSPVFAPRPEPPPPAA